jgi:hypothetical protein
VDIGGGTVLTHVCGAYKQYRRYVGVAGHFGKNEFTPNLGNALRRASNGTLLYGARSP